MEHSAADNAAGQPHFFEQGQVLLIDKPYDWTSFDVVKKLRRLVKTRKIGHAGTLDPLATGLLILCTGKYTKRINEYMAQEKEYTGTITLGAKTPTYDLESQPVDQRDYSAVTEAGVTASSPANLPARSGRRRPFIRPLKRTEKECTNWPGRGRK
jgi:tRNA U55 pseudouridine synthase TruB